jgi:hypothetical protein
MKPDLDGFLYDAVRESSRLIQDGNTAEINGMTRVESMPCHSRFLRLTQENVSHVFFTSGLDGSANMSYIKLATFTSLQL